MIREFVARLSWMLVLLVGCGGAQTEGEGTTGSRAAAEAPAPPSDPWAYFPTNVLGVVRVDTEKLRASPYDESLTPLLARLGEGGDGLELGTLRFSGGDLDRLRATKLVMAAQTSGEEGAIDTLLVLEGAPSGPALEAWLSELGARQTPPVQVTRHDRGSLEIWSVGALSVAELGRVRPGFVIAGTGMGWEGMLERALGRRGGTPKDDPAFVRLCQKVSCETAMGASVGEVDERVRERVRRRTQAILPGGVVDQVHRYGMRIEAGQGIEALLVAEMGDGQHASGIASRLESQRRGMLGGVQGMLLRAIGATTLIEAISVTAEGADVHATLALSDEDARRVLNHLDQLIEMAEQGRIGVSL